MRRVLLTAGKVHYDLRAYREKNAVTDIALVRVERLYPTPVAEIAEALAAYPNATDVVWVQEEPANQGSWQYMACKPARAPACRSHPAWRLAQGRRVPGGRLAQGSRRRAAHPGRERLRLGLLVYFTDRGIEELARRRGEETLTMAALADRLRSFLDEHPRVRDGRRATGHLAGA